MIRNFEKNQINWMKYLTHTLGARLQSNESTLSKKMVVFEKNKFQSYPNPIMYS